jgi:hypothetical protein
MWQNYVLAAWVGPILELANGRATTDAEQRARLRAALENVVDGGPGIAEGTPLHAETPLPRLKIRRLHGRAVLVAEPPPDAGGKILEEHFAVVALMAMDPRAACLRRCDWPDCRAFFFVRRDHRREHSFCCEEHRRQYDVANRDPQKVAEGMRKWRAQKAEQRRRLARSRARKGRG